MYIVIFPTCEETGFVGRQVIEVDPSEGDTFQVQYFGIEVCKEAS